VRTLFPDVAAEQARYFGVTGFVPMNHCVVVRRALLERHPWVAINLYQAFASAKEAGRAAVREALELPLEAGVLDGAAANRGALETLLAYSREQGLTRGAVELEALFAASVLDL
jgi:4,5-dihydroxyphthalate decarboxylase